MPKRYIDNPSAAPIIVGGVFIPPGEGREVDEALLPPEQQAEPQGWAETQPPPSDDPEAALVELLKGPLKDILPALDALTDAQLAALQALEGAAVAPRVTLTQKIAALQLDRAAAAAAAAEGSQAGTEPAGGTEATGDTAANA